MLLLHNNVLFIKHSLQHIKLLNVISFHGSTKCMKKRYVFATPSYGINYVLTVITIVNKYDTFIALTPDTQIRPHPERHIRE